MKSQIRRAGFSAVSVLTVAIAFWEAAPAVVAAFSEEQAAPATGSMPAPIPQTKAIPLEQRADIFMARKNYADAADYYYRALKQSSFKNSVVWNKLGIAFQQMSKFHSARQAYTHAARADKTFAEAWNNIGTTYFMEDKVGKSVKYYQRAVELKPYNASFHMNLGVSYSRLKKYDQAVEEYRTALGIDPKVMFHESSVGTVVHANGTDVEYYFYMAKAFASLGNAEDAVRYLRHALEDGFNDPKRIGEDSDFKKISQYPAFVELMRNPPVAIKN
ncbi:MAG TPA: tetratricopeptide repeat protein [Terriglobia bacterium]|nr:tetratricopeptide repeat protein [Terriglobia bacterium]